MIDKSEPFDENKIFSSLIGTPAWSVAAEFGTYITMQFGTPHLYIRDPITPSAAASDIVAAQLRKRKVVIKGDFQFSILNCKWQIRIGSSSASSFESNLDEIHPIVDQLNGQILKSVMVDHVTKRTDLRFDLGGILEMSPDDEMGPEEVQWTLYIGENKSISYTTDGKIIAEG